MTRQFCLQAAKCALIMTIVFLAAKVVILGLAAAGVPTP